MTELRRREHVVGGARRLRPTGAALGGFSILVVLLTVVVGLVAQPHRPAERWLTGPAWLDGWIEYDSFWYYGIATHGYSYTPGQQSPIAFFPTYPLLVRGLAAVLGDTQVAGMLITVVAGAAAVVLFAVWTSSWLARPAAVTAVLLILLYPYSFFLYGTMYADAVFLLTAIAAFVLLERQHPWLAGLVGILATAGRPVGAAVLVGLAVRAWELRAAQTRTGKTPTTPMPLRALLGSWRELRVSDFGVLVSALGLAGWCTYLWLTFGDPLAFVAVESAPGWEQGSGPRTWFKAAFVGQLLNGTPQMAVILGAQGVFCLAAVLLLPRVWRRFGWGYLAYTLVVIGIPILGSKDFMGCGRYLLAAFPVFAAAAEVVTASRHRWLRPAVLAVFAVGLLVGTVCYAGGLEVS